MEAHVQGTLLHEGKRQSDLRLYERSLIGAAPAYTTFDFSMGVKKDRWSVDFFIKNAFDQRGQIGRFFQCSEAVCANDVVDTAEGYPAYPPPPATRSSNCNSIQSSPPGRLRIVPPGTDRTIPRALPVSPPPASAWEAAATPLRRD